MGDGVSVLEFTLLFTEPEVGIILITSTATDFIIIITGQMWHTIREEEKLLPLIMVQELITCEMQPILIREAGIPAILEALETYVIQMMIMGLQEEEQPLQEITIILPA